MSEVNVANESNPGQNFTGNLDRLNREDDMIEKYLVELVQTLNDIDRESIWAITNVLFRAWEDGRKVFIMGNGGSAATASHMANDLNKYTIVPGKKRFKAIALTDNVPLMTAWGNDDSYESIFSEQLINFLGDDDVLIAISASGNSANILKGVTVGRELGAITIGLTGDTGGRLKDLVDYVVLAPSPKIGQQEDCHMILDHVIAYTLRELIKDA